MEPIYCATLEALELEIKKLSLAVPRAEFVFRGQGNSEWKLETTLERAGRERMSLDSYYRLAVARASPAVETFVDASWKVPSYSLELEEKFRSDRQLFGDLTFPSPDFYQYLIYLRHHGFPSPLLDWTSSLYIAVFFAFRHLNASERRSVYVYCESPLGFKGWALGEPAMRAIGKYIKAHPRHYRQQSDYTICMAFDESTGGWRFHGHDSVFRSRGKQDYLWKFELPSTERDRILRFFDQFNLNAFSLFDSNETLLESVWNRENDKEL
jgi:hypothetical protein